MKFLVFTLLTTLLVVFINSIAPYWVVMITIAVLAALLHPSNLQGFIGGGFGMGVAWLGQILHIQVTTSSTLPDKMAELMGMDSGFTLMGLTAALGVILGGCSGLLGVLFRNLVQKKPTDVYLG